MMPNVVPVYVRILEKAASNQANLELFHSENGSVLETLVFSGGFGRFSAVGLLILESMPFSQRLLMPSSVNYRFWGQILNIAVCLHSSI